VVNQRDSRWSPPLEKQGIGREYVCPNRHVVLRAQLDGDLQVLNIDADLSNANQTEG
jgi:hypothetical protein